LDAAGFAPSSIALNKPSLDDVFLKLTGRAIRDDEAEGRTSMMRAFATRGRR